MANEIISLQNLQRFKSNCDGAYSGKLYWHTVAISITGGTYQGGVLHFTVVSTKSTALTKNNLGQKFAGIYLNGWYEKGNARYPLVYLDLALIYLQFTYYDILDTANFVTTTSISGSQWSVTDVVTEVL